MGATWLAETELGQLRATCTRHCTTFISILYGGQEQPNLTTREAKARSQLQKPVPFLYNVTLYYVNPVPKETKTNKEDLTLLRHVS